MGRFTVQILFGSLSSLGDGIVRITLLTQVKKKRPEQVHVLYMYMYCTCTVATYVQVQVHVYIIHVHVHVHTQCICLSMEDSLSRVGWPFQQGYMPAGEELHGRSHPF